MLTGIRTGKKKKRRIIDNDNGGKEKQHQRKPSSLPTPMTTLTTAATATAAAATATTATAATTTTTTTTTTKKTERTSNQSAADTLRRQLLIMGGRLENNNSGSGGDGDGRGSRSSNGIGIGSGSGRGSGSGSGSGRGSGRDAETFGWQRRLERSGSAKKNQQNAIHHESNNDDDDDDDTTIILTGTAAASVTLQKEDLRRGSRKGKLKREYVDVSGTTTREEANMSIADMIAEERNTTNNNTSMDEIYARNVARVGSRYKGTDFGGGGGGSKSGADEDDYTNNNNADMTMFQQQRHRLTERAYQNQQRSRQIALHDKTKAITAKCWWWLESPSFRKHTMLLSLGNHVSLVMAPANQSLWVGKPGHHFYLVPIKHAESFVSCCQDDDDGVWDEVQRFTTALCNMYAKENKTILLCETVLPTKRFWQARMECIVVPKSVEQDAPMYFRSSLMEQAEEWGTHNKLLHITPQKKGLGNTIPKNFPYFYIGWNQGKSGYAQIIENTENTSTFSFPKDFGVDTIGGIMGLDPMKVRAKPRQRQRQRQHGGDRAGKDNQEEEEERKAVLAFCQKWKEFDWTLELDD